MESCSRLTAAEGGSRLAATVGAKNLMITEHTNFIPTSLLVECAFAIRGPLSSCYQRTIYVTRQSRIACVAHELKILTDLKVVAVLSSNDVQDWSQELEENQVIVCTSAVLSGILKEGYLTMTQVNVLVVDSCHLIFLDEHLQYIMKLYKDCEELNRPRILAMTYPLFQSTKDSEWNNTPINCDDEIDKTPINVTVEKNNDSTKLNDNLVHATECALEDNEDSNKENYDLGFDDVNNSKAEILGDTEADESTKDKDSEKTMCVIEHTNTDYEATINDSVKSAKDMSLYKNLDDFDMYEKLEWKIEELERQLCCEMDLAEDIDGGKRLSPSITKPKEVIVEFAHQVEGVTESYKELESFMRTTIIDAMEFINEHRYDPTEIYGEELYEEFMNIPDPTLEPKEMLYQFLYVLDELGPYAADKAAFSLLTKLEKLKIKVPYERHFLLLCLCTSVFVKIRCYADLVFEKCETDWKKLSSFSTPKVLRFASILEQFQPENKDNLEIVEQSIKCVSEEHNDDKDAINTKTCDPQITQNNDNTMIDKNFPEKRLKRSRTTELLDEINKCDFNALGNKIEDNVNIIESNLKEFDESNHTSEIRLERNMESAAKNISEECEINTGYIVNITVDKDDTITVHNISDNCKSNDRITNTVNETVEENKIDVKTDQPVLIYNDNSTCNNVITTTEVNPNDREVRNIIESFELIRNSDVIVNESNSDTSKDSEIVLQKDNEVRNSNNIVTDLINSDLLDNEAVSKNNCTSVENDCEKKACVQGSSGLTHIGEKNNSELIVEEVKKDSLEPVLDESVIEVKNNSDITEVKSSDAEQRVYKRGRGRGRGRKHNVKTQPQTNDSLCGIVFMKEPLMAKIMFMMIVDMSRSRPSLSHLCAQYCAVESVEEPKESQRQGRKQEDVLKKFRMHECNLLLATSALEEGIDLPRCNLVVRWDVPQSYRSYGLCRSRARASKSSVALLANAEKHSCLLIHNLAIYKELDQIVTRKCGCGIQNEPPQEEEFAADVYTPCIKAYSPINTCESINKRILDKIRDVNESVCGIRDKSSEIHNVNLEEFNKNQNGDILYNNVVTAEGTSVEELREVNIIDERQTNEYNQLNRELLDNIVENTEELSSVSKEMVHTVNDLGNNHKQDSTKHVKELKTVEDSKIPNDEKNQFQAVENENVNEIEDVKNSEIIEFKSDEEIGLPNSSKKYKDMHGAQNVKDNKSECRTISDSKNYSLDFRELSDSKVSDIVGKGEKVSEREMKVEYDVKKCEESFASVDLNSAIALINRYCGKLPSDTFTRLAPQWWIEEVQLPANGELKPAYICTLRMPLNCPVKYNIVGHPMPTRVLARRMVALQACRILHKSGELDDQLMPIGKENFKAADMDANLHPEVTDVNDSARPGTTKRRQYYYKRTAWTFTDCQPIIDTSDDEIEANPTPKCKPNYPSGTKRNMLYAIMSNLWCALPERYNTRGRKLHLPQHATQAIGILVARCEPTKLQIPAFPVYTRSGEVRVSVEPALSADVRLSPRRAKLIRRFMRFVFSDVLRVRRRGMKLQTEGSTQNNYYVVPTVKKTTPEGSTIVDIDWAFLELIYSYTEEKKIQEQENPAMWQKKDSEQKLDNPLLRPGEVFVFDPEKYSEAVVTPWYRNQDQPQFFLVAEICWHLTPDSAFPSEQHATFRSYYKGKYGADLTQTDQPLLDVDHTSARLNLLTPRYVNRKGVALPVSSERTRRAKRDRLDQKQIMVPELCKVHPFAAPLWFATVALPCVLYRINALLIADEIRRAVAIDVGLGIPRIDNETCPGFTWPALDFGWSLSEVLSADSEKLDKKRELDDLVKGEELEKEQRDKEEQENEDKAEDAQEPKEKTINDILQEKEEAESGFEIGTWSNEMASSIPQSIDYDEFMEPLPPNLTFCTSATGGANWSEPINKPKSYTPGRKFSMADSDCSYLSSDFDTDDSDFNSEGSDEDSEGFCSSKNTNAAMGVRIEYKTAHEAEAVDVERRKPVAPAPIPDRNDDLKDLAAYKSIMRDGTPPEEHVINFRNSVKLHEKEIMEDGHLINKNEPVKDLLPEGKEIDVICGNSKTSAEVTMIDNIIKQEGEDLNKDNEKTLHNTHSVGDYAHVKHKEKIDNVIARYEENNLVLDEPIVKVDRIVTNNEIITRDVKQINEFDRVHQTSKTDTLEDVSNSIKSEENNFNKLETITDKAIDDRISELFPYLNGVEVVNGQVTLEAIERNKRKLLAELRVSLTEEDIKKLNCFSMVDIDIDSADYVNEKVANVGFDARERYEDLVKKWGDSSDLRPYYLDSKGQSGGDFDFDYQPSLEGHPGPSPSVILQALTMSNANDGINLERLETIGDSFLKFAITAYLYCAHPAVHEGKLSHMRSKQVSNLNLYRLGRNKRLGARMIASKFEPHDNWLPPCHKPPPTLQPGISNDQEDSEKRVPQDNTGCFIPYNLITQHSIPDKSIADCVEALIGAYLLECGPRGALLFMSWLGIRVLPCHLIELPEDHPYVARQSRKEASNTEEKTPQKTYEPLSSDTESCCSSDEESTPDVQPPPEDWSWPGRAVGSLRPYRDGDAKWVQPVFGALKAPPSPLLRYIEDPEGELEIMLSGYEELERTLQYRFRDRSLLLQALTHASHQKNRLTDCYQRLEFLGDAILDYLITRHLYEDPRRHSPGALTDLRSALVNNTIFATLAARHGFHKYFRHMSPGLNEVLTKYVKIQEENGHSISEEHYLIQEDEMEQAEDVEVPKALGDLFESVAGAIFLDSGMSLGAVWRSYARLMMAELEAFSAAAPKSPVRELLEAEPDTAKFGKPERLADGRRVRVCVEVFGRGTFKGIGRNYRIAKGTAARCALRHLKIHRAR
ncbi:unnamed protein product [Leptosia nina]|uniref:ribonuclease III n=1 Tax=Leptosia nina TaxID=320188 RepID=A0AAV1JZM1_9NEOP